MEAEAGVFSEPQLDFLVFVCRVVVSRPGAHCTGIAQSVRWPPPASARLLGHARHSSRTFAPAAATVVISVVIFLVIL